MGIFEDLEARVTKLEADLKAEKENSDLTHANLNKNLIEFANDVDARLDTLESTEPTPIPPVEPPVPEPTGFKLGINLAQQATWGTERLFPNVLMNASPWRLCRPTSPLKPFATDGALPVLNDMGLPTVALPMANGLTIRTDIFCDNGEKFPIGDYHLQFEGAGEIQLMCGSKAQTLKAPGGMFNVPATTKLGIQLVITKNDAANPIKNLSLMASGSAAPSGEFLKPFTIVRMMDLQKTNDSPVTDKFVKDYTIPHLDNGCPWDYLQNDSKSTWLSLPHLSTDKFNMDFAVWAKANLGTVYVEYSNELWNGQFTQSKWVMAQSGATSGSEFQAKMAPFIAKEAVKRFKIWEEVFGSERSRLKFVVAGQNANIGVAKSVADNVKAMGFKFDVLSSAPYFQENSGVFSTNADTVLANCEKYLSEKTIPGMKAHIELAKTHGVKWIAYEAGQHLIPGTAQPYTQAYYDAQNKPKMAELYKALLKAAKDNGADGMVFFNSCRKPDRNGCWGAIEYTGQDLKTAPKYQAIVSS